LFDVSTSPILPVGSLLETSIFLDTPGECILAMLLDAMFPRDQERLDGRLFGKMPKTREASELGPCLCTFIGVRLSFCVKNDAYTFCLQT
jgi:hypothetical protein